jgi:hypothetical protein
MVQLCLENGTFWFYTQPAVKAVKCWVCQAPGGGSPFKCLMGYKTFRSLSICDGCHSRLKPILTSYFLTNQLPVQLCGDPLTLFKKDTRYECIKCDINNWYSNLESDFTTNYPNDSDCPYPTSSCPGCGTIKYRLIHQHRVIQVKCLKCLSPLKRLYNDSNSPWTCFDCSSTPKIIDRRMKFEW